MASNIEIAASPRGGAADKIKKYGWTLRDEPGVLMMVGKHELRIDHTYQRDYSEPRSNKMASNWSWVACGALIVADRGGEFYVVVGQHRLNAALKRSDIKELPCLVFQSDGVSQEASGFLSEAMDRKGVDWVDQLRAKVVCGDQVAIRVGELCESVNRHVARHSGSNTVACISLLYKELSADAELAEGIFRLMASICEGVVFDHRLFGALCYCERRVVGGQSFYKPGPLRDRVIRLGPNVLLDEIGRACAFYARGGVRVWADAVIMAINKGLRVNKVSLAKEDSDE